jgi:hypothetical protein
MLQMNDAPCFVLAFSISELGPLLSPIGLLYSTANIEMAQSNNQAGATLVTVDDFDPLVAYSKYEDWTTPDPSQNPTWFNASQEVTGSPWHQGT